MKNITSIILILVSIGIFFFFIDPKYKEIKEINAQISENNKTLEVAQKLRAQREDLSTRFNQISREEKEDLEKLLPDTVDNVRLIIDIENIANQAGIVVRDIDIRSPEQETSQTRTTTTTQGSLFNQSDSAIRYVDTNRIGVITFSFTITTRYEDFLRFLKQLEQSKRIVDIRGIELSRGTGDSAFFDYKVTFDTYWLK